MDEEERKALKQCHWGNKFVFRWRDLNFFGAGSFRGLDTSGIDVIIDCGADVSQNTADIYMGKGLAPTQPIQIIRINWPDGGSPTLTEKNWLSLIKKLEKIKLHWLFVDVERRDFVTMMIM